MDAINKVEAKINRSMGSLPFSNVVRGLVFAMIVILSNKFVIHLPTNVTEMLTTKPALILSLAFLINMSADHPLISLGLAFTVVTLLNTISHKETVE